MFLQLHPQQRQKRGPILAVALGHLWTKHLLNPRNPDKEEKLFFFHQQKKIVTKKTKTKTKTKTETETKTKTKMITFASPLPLNSPKTTLLSLQLQKKRVYSVSKVRRDSRKPRCRRGPGLIQTFTTQMLSILLHWCWWGRKRRTNRSWLGGKGVDKTLSMPLLREPWRLQFLLLLLCLVLLLQKIGLVLLLLLLPLDFLVVKRRRKRIKEGKSW
mmetsp:Transcript_36464/g.57202  ORF Transcript_36464/g.57202 Transcript_36464/m.57202 type:complete len:215 (+) Transcript_36464:664-1308(+)